MVEVCHDQLLLAVVDWWGLAVSASIGMSGAPRCVGQGELRVSRTAYNHDLHHQQHLDLVLKVKMWVEETVLSTTIQRSLVSSPFLTMYVPVCTTMDL